VTTRGLVVIVSGFPRHSETFALTELNALDRDGMLAAVFSTKPGEDGGCQPSAERLRDRVQLLAGDPSLQAARAAQQLASSGARVSGVHAYFAHTPAAVAAALARRLHVPFGFSVHARDARKVTRTDLHDRARRAACVVACNSDVATEFAGSGAQVTLVPHGVDLGRFRLRPRPASDTFVMLAVGRLVEKKGFHVLVDAVSQLECRWHLRIVGDGPEKAPLLARVRARGVAEHVTFCGSLTHDALPAEFNRADAVVVPSVCDSTGDRDGLPNVVLEAMASGAPLVASDAGAITSVVRDGDTGLVAPAGDAAALTRALTRLAAAPAVRERLGASARAAVERDFDAQRCTRRFVSVLREAYA
jgi:glycosyltransferase involved in cell wall biosynthesis